MEEPLYEILAQYQFHSIGESVRGARHENNVTRNRETKAKPDQTKSRKANKAARKARRASK